MVIASTHVKYNWHLVFLSKLCHLNIDTLGNLSLQEDQVTLLNLILPQITNRDSFCKRHIGPAIYNYGILTILAQNVG